MANNINENFNTKVTHDELVKNASKAGKASVEARRVRKTLKEELLLLLEKEDIQEKISLALVTRALTPDNMGNKAFEVIRDTIGEKPKDKIEIENEKPFEVNIKVVE